MSSFDWTPLDVPVAYAGPEGIRVSGFSADAVCHAICSPLKHHPWHYFPYYSNLIDPNHPKIASLKPLTDYSGEVFSLLPREDRPMLLLPPAAPAPMLFKALLKLLNFASWRSLGRCLPFVPWESQYVFPNTFLSEHQGTHDVTKTGTNGAVGHRGCPLSRVQRRN